jgi:hypothetical protein
MRFVKNKEKRMKKFLIVLCILIVVCAVSFFIGWAQFTVPVGSYGVMQSKSHGLETKTIMPGKLIWVWYKLIPGNVKISVFTTAPRSISFSAGGVLPLSNVYTGFTGLKADFEYAVDAQFQYKLNPDSLPEFVSNHNIFTQDELEAYLDALDENIKTFAISRIGDFAGGEAMIQTLESEEGEKTWLDMLRPEFPFFEWERAIFYLKKEPDFELYADAKSLYVQYLDRQREILRDETALQAGGRVISQFRLDELEKYGELLTRYPILLEFLKLKENE